MTSRYTHLLAMVALVVLVASGPAFAQTIDYDEDDDNYIDISTHQQLNAVRWDLNSNGVPESNQTNYDAAFPNAAAGMGCASTCVGYELVADIDLDTSGSGGTTYTSADAYHNSGDGWSPIGSLSSGYTGNFKGNQWEIKNLFISRTASDQGLFSRISSGGRVESLGVTGAAVTGTSYVGILTGYNFGEIVACYTTGSVTGSGANSGYLGGLVGHQGGSVTTSYSQASVTGRANLGGLVGWLDTGDTVTNSYSTGSVTLSGGSATSIGGLIGAVSSSTPAATVAASYWDTTSSGRTTSPGGGTGYSTSALQTPTAYGTSGIYSTWNIDLDGVTGNDDPWNFGTASQYPTLKYGFYNIDYDEDDDGLIDVETIAQLNAMRDDINGNGDATTTTYANAFPRRHTASGSRMGCPSGSCTGYELVANLDFDSDEDGDVDANDHGGAYWNSGAGWNPIGDIVFNRWSTTFKGNGHTINNLLINRNTLDYASLFRAINTSGRVESLGITNADVRGLDRTGILVGVNYGTIVACYTTGSVQVPNTQDKVGGLVGTMNAASGGVFSSYSTASVLGNQQVGGLIGEKTNGSVTNSYAAGSVAGHGSTPSNIGGLIGSSSGSGTISNNYWDTTASGRTSSAGGSGVVGKTTAQLQSPTTYTGIYANWNADLDSDNYPDNPWNFGTSSQYPTLYTPAQREQQQVIDYDRDNDGLIDVQSLDQLNAIRHDLDGNGLPESTGNYAAYAGAFPAGELATAATRMGCPSGTCTGYELLNDLDFDTTGDDTVTAADAYPNWSPLGDYTATFEGKGHTISNLTISSGSDDVGLFGELQTGGVIREVGLVNVNMQAGVPAGSLDMGSLVGYNRGGTIIASYARGGRMTAIGPSARIGGLVGRNTGMIRASYATVAVTGGTGSSVTTGGLVGTSGSVSTANDIVASYAAGPVTGSTGANANTGGLVGIFTGTNTYTSVTNSYCDTSVYSPCSNSGIGVSASATGYTTAQLQGPTGYGYTGIYASWNLDLNGDNVLDYPWNFGTSSQYPTLNTSAQRVIARQIRISISSQSVAEGAAGATATLRFTVQLNRVHTSQVTVAYADAGTGTAESGTDYTALAGGTLTFAAGQTSKTIDVSVIGDAVAEPDETVIVTLSNPSPADAVLAVATGTGTITNDDGSPTEPGTEPEPEPDPDPTFTEAVDPRSYPQGNEIDPLTLPEAIDGTGTLTYALTPDLPDGLTFDAETLTVSGTPTEATEKAIYTLTATDEDGDAAEVSFFLTISANLIPSFGDASVDAQSLMRKQEIESLTLPQATGGDAPLTYALSPDLPEGLKFDAETRIVSGTPTEAMDETTYTLTATDGNGDPATLMFTLEVMTDPIPAFGDTTIAAQGYQHQAFAPLTLPQASGGDAPLTYALNPDPPLPEGLTFDVETLTVSGTPLKAMDEMTYTLTATDDNGDEVHLMFTLEVPDLMPTFGDTTIAAQSYLVNQEIESLTFPQASSGDGMLVYILLPSLPDGISFNPDTRTLSGMPTTEKTLATYTLSALDTDGDVASLPFTLEVSLPSPDFNGDGVVNFADFLIFADKFGSRLGQERYDARCDLNGDSQINFDDFLDFAAAFGSSG